ncbi:tape measure protein [Duganella phyllosphaerae]|uniref:Tape measure protein N-terminal domain-containing protein n=1 Tax=Duganella phyllosphaerae TaxID=762836 RepID=A0A1E7W4U8_9BURK|nr:tape measure protein [Duganella phyllosphaerae]OEZ90728.1 hypothetical protein DUPY_53350 [Duganella phyllosphaerae]
MIVGDMEIRLRADIARLQRDMDQARRVVNDTANGIGRAADAMKMALAGIGLGVGLGGLARMADEYNKFTAQLRLATTSQREYAAAMDDVRRIANSAQQDLAATGTLYARISNGTRELGIQQKQVAKITETVNLSLLVSGATASESASAQLQLSQAFASGTLRGEEFNAVNEAAPRLMKALADGMGLPIGALKEMAGNGEITSKIMAEVLPAALVALREEAKQIQTIGGAMTVLKNRTMELVGVQAQASGAVSVINSALDLLGQNIGLVVGAIGTLGAAKLGSGLAAWAVDSYRAAAASSAQATATLAAAARTTEAAAATAAAKLAAAQADVRAAAAASSLAAARVAELRASVLAAEGATALAITTNGLIPAQARLLALEQARTAALAAQAVAAGAATTTAAAATAALGAQAAAATLATRAMTLLRGVMSMFGGPIGVIITLLGAAAMAWSHFSDKAKESNQDTAESFEEAQVRIVKGLDEQIAKQEALLRLKGKGIPVQQADKEYPIIKQIEEGQRRVAEMEKTMKPSVGESLKDFATRYKREVDGVLELQKKLPKAREGEKKVGEQTTADRVAGLKKEMATSAEKMAAELKAIEDLKGKTGEYDDLVARIRKKYEDKGAASALKQEETAYKTLITSIKEKIAANELEMAGYNQLTESQKLTIKLDAEVATGKTKLNAGDIERARALIAVVATTDGVIASNKLAAEGLAGFTKMQKEHDDQVAKTLLAAQDEAAKNEELVLTYGMSKAAIEQMELARLESQYAQRVSNALTQQEITDLEALIAAKQRSVAAVTKIETLDTGSDVTRAKELLDILVAVDNAAKSAAQGMAASFGTVGTAIGGLTTALTDYAVQQQAVAAQLAAVKADPKSSADKIAKAEMAASKASAQAQVKSYGDMAAAGKGFFKENSKGYKLMETTERAFRAYEMAMAVESMVKKIFFKEGEVAANLALNATKLSGEAATTGASVALAGTEASAWGITAVVKAIASLPFPLNLAAGAATLAAVLAIGAKVMGGVGSGGLSVSQQRQESQGTGTVFGDSTAKSDSIKRSLELVSSNSSIELNYTQGMLAALRNIESSLGGLGNVLVRNSGLTGATAAPVKGSAQQTFDNVFAPGSLGEKLTGGVVGKIVGSIFGGKKTVEDTGFKIDPTTLAQAMAGNLNSFQYTDIKKSGGLLRSDKTNTSWDALGAEADTQFALVLGSLGQGVTEAAKLLGLGGDEFTKRLNGFVVDIGKISLKGMNGEEIQKTLEAVFSKLGDDMASYAVAGLDVFAKIGEGPLETLTRIAANYANLDSILASSGTSFGQMGMASIAARERLIELAGGIDDLASLQSGFNDNFLTEAERLAPVQKYVTGQLAAMGLQSLDTRDKFKDYVLGLANSGKLATDAGAAQYTSLLALADAFAKTHAATEDLTQSEQEIADERKDLAQQLAEITKSEAELLAIQRAGIADVNKSLFDQVQAAKAVVTAKDALSAAYDREASAAKTALDRSKAWVTTLNGLNPALAQGNLSTLTPEQKYAEARAQFEKTLAAANSGDTTAQSGLSAAEQAFLTASQVVNASDAKYAADYARVIAANQEAVKWASQQVDLQQASYDALEAQVKSLITINDSVLTVAQAIANLQIAMGVTDGLGVKFTEAPAVTAMVASAAPAIDYSRYSAASNAGSDALVAEIRGLRDDNKVLQEKVERQTAVLARVTAESNEKAAGTVVAGVEKSAKASAWTSTVKGVYAE